MRPIRTREPSRSVQTIPVSRSRNPSARAIASTSASKVQPSSRVREYAATAASARHSLKPQNRSLVGSLSTARQSCWKLRPTIRRRSGCRRPSSAPAARREPTTTSQPSIRSIMPGSDGRQTAQSASQCSRSAPRASSIPRRIEWPLPRLTSLRTSRTRAPSSSGSRRATVASSLALSTTSNSKSPGPAESQSRSRRTVSAMPRSSL